MLLLVYWIINASNHAKCGSLNDQQCMTQLTLINLHPNEHSQGLQYYLVAFNLDRCVGSFNTLNGLSDKVRVPNKTEDLNLSVFNMIMRMNQSKTLTKHISCKCKYKFDDGKCNIN